MKGDNERSMSLPDVAGNIDDGDNPRCDDGTIPLLDERAPRRTLLPLYILMTVYAFTVFLNPLEPYFTNFMVDDKSVSEDQVLHDLFPLWTYSYFAWVALVVSVAEFLSYKTLLLLCTFVGVVVPAVILALFSGIWWLRVDEVVDGLGQVAGLMFTCYMFKAAPRVDFQFISSVTRSANLLASGLGAVLGQVLLQWGHVSLSGLNLINGATSVIALVCACFFRPVERSISSDGVVASFRAVIREVTNRSSLLRWCVYAAWSLATHQLVVTYAPLLWLDMADAAGAHRSVQTWNGAVLAIAYVVSAICAYVPSRIEAWTRAYGSTLQVVMPALGSICLAALTMAPSLPLSYVAFVLYHCTFEFIFPIAGASTARKMSTKMYATVFGVNTTFGLVVQVLLQIFLQPLKVQDVFTALTVSMAGLSLVLACWKLCSTLRKRLSL